MPKKTFGSLIVQPFPLTLPLFDFSMREMALSERRTALSVTPMRAVRFSMKVNHV
jgi:hypothetical protein